MNSRQSLFNHPELRIAEGNATETDKNGSAEPRNERIEYRKAFPLLKLWTDNFV